MAVQATSIADLSTFTLSKFRKNKWIDHMSGFQKTIAMKQVFHKGKGDVGADDGGTTVTFNIITDTNGSAKFVGLAPTVTLSPPGNVVQGSIPWRGWTYNWWFDGPEIVMNSGVERIVNIMKTRYFQAVGDIVKVVEKALWRVPATTDDTSIYGIPYYVVKSATAATYANADGFNGTVPSGYTTVAGINPTTYPRYTNYTDAYTLVSKDDLIRKMRRMAEFTDFKPLVDGESIDELGNGTGLYTNYPVYGSFVEVAEAQNDDLGPDVASMDGGKVMFRRKSLDWLPILSDDTTGPVYLIDWSTMAPIRMKGWWEKEIHIPLNPQQPTVDSTHVFTRANLLCIDRRKNGVISTGTTMPT